MSFVRTVAFGAAASLVLVALAGAAPTRTSGMASSWNGPELHAPDEARHLTLRRSAPADGTSVATPSEIRLWFSQEPQRGSTTVTVTGPAGAVAVGNVTVDADDNRTFFAPVESALPAGSYRVNWRTMASDGHVIRGEFGFTVTAE